MNEEEARDTLFHLEHINGYVDLYKEHDVIIKSDVLLKWKNAIKTVINLLEKKNKQIEQYQNMLATNDMLHVLELEKKDKIIDLMAEELSKLNYIQYCNVTNCNYPPCNKKQCTKQYFERKVEEK